MVHHGILQADGTHADDPTIRYPKWKNYSMPQIENPNSDLYDAYKLVKSFLTECKKHYGLVKEPTKKN